MGVRVLGLLQTEIESLGDESVHKAFVVQTWGLKFKPQNLHKKQAEQCPHTHSQCREGIDRRIAGESFASLPSLTGEFLASERPCLRKQDDSS